MNTSQQLAVIAGTTAAAVAVAVVALIDDIINEPGPRVIRHPGGTEWASEYAASLLCGDRDNFHQMFRVSKRNFMNIVAWLQHHNFVKDTQYQSSEHKLMIGLYILGQGARQRTTSNKFQVAQSTVSEIYQQVLTGLVALHDEVVKQPDASYVSPQIELKDKYGCFTGCIGAIDGTLLPAHVPARMKKRFISRKGQPQQNVLCAIRFDGIFTYVLAGAEGSMNDAALMRQARSRSFNPPAGRYYLGDAGFACERGILTPFLGERYHQAETRAYIDATSAKEAYNILHAGRRVRIENLFGDIKKRWLLLENCPAEYSYKDQVRMVYAVTAVHNFVALKRQDDVPLNPTQDWALEMARRQANEVVGMRAGKAVRHDVAIWAWEALEARRARRRDNNNGRRSDDDDAIEVVI